MMLLLTVCSSATLQGVSGLVSLKRQAETRVEGGSYNYAGVGRCRNPDGSLTNYIGFQWASGYDNATCRAACDAVSSCIAYDYGNTNFCGVWGDTLVDADRAIIIGTAGVDTDATYYSGVGASNGVSIVYSLGPAVSPQVGSGHAGWDCWDQTSSPTSVSGKGDPHMVNVLGQKFDLYQPGVHPLIKIPKSGKQRTALLVQARASRLGADCADLYFTEMNITGAWADKVRAGGLTFTAGGARDETLQTPGWTRFGPLQLKVVHGRTSQGIEYLNFYVKHLTEAGAAVGGLLGEDDYTDAARPEEGCRKSMSLKKKATSNSDVGHTEAIASLA